MNVLLSGASGFGGQGILKILTESHYVRGTDLRENGSCSEWMLGDVADLNFCRRAVEGMDAVVICHMAPYPDGYKTPDIAVDINVKGAANLYHAMIESGIRRAVLISSAGVLRQEAGIFTEPGVGPYPDKVSLYYVTKIMQEMLARHYFVNDGISTAILRCGWVVNEDSLATKYGAVTETYAPHILDPRDIGYAVKLALELKDPGLESFILTQADYEADHTATRDRLGWIPKHRFDILRRANKSCEV